MTFQDDVAAIAAEHGPHVAIEYAAQAMDAFSDGILPGLRLGDFMRQTWSDFWNALLLSGLRTAASSGALHELAYYTMEVNDVR